MMNRLLLRATARVLTLAGVVLFAAGPLPADDAPPEATAAAAPAVADDVAANADLHGYVVIAHRGDRRKYECAHSFDLLVDRPGFAAADHSFLIVCAADADRYCIGLQCAPADETLRLHLRLDGQGLVVRSIVPDLPADSAGLREHDILLSVDDEPLDSVDQLTNAIEAAAGSPIELTYLRAGGKRTVQLTPVKGDMPSVLTPQRHTFTTRRFTQFQPVPVTRYQPSQVTQYQPVPVTEYQSVPVTQYRTATTTPYYVHSFGPGILLPQQPAGAESDRIGALESRIEELATQIDELRQALDERE